MKKLLVGTALAVNFSIATAMGYVGGYHYIEQKTIARLAPITVDDRYCLQQNIYFESRDQSFAGQHAVAWVTLNRFNSAAFPDTICGVVYQSKKDKDGKPKRDKCQFSWYCDGKSDIIPTGVIAQRSWGDAGIVASNVLAEWAVGSSGPVEGATFYHADWVKPYWAPAFRKVKVVDNHIFYVNDKEKK
jgi:N-acetylmuramoyl-L-alanine amidase